MRTLEEIFPPFGLRITCGPLELRCVRESDAPIATDLAARGIYEPAELPFLRRWAEAAEHELALNTAQFYWRTFADFRPDDWHLIFLASHEGTPVGVQDVSAKDFIHVRSIITGSWLSREHQGKGIGTLMRQAVCALGFDELGAEEMISGYMVGNAASAAVSRKVGYEPNGQIRGLHPDGDRVRVEQRVRLLPHNFIRAPWPVEVEGAGPFREFIGI
ncbi:GNAT family N-acetyltransferase [Luteococcus sp. Sow4_B9]|uniref:GNAT family N-acetyltransferase n=1 Tax=Luteococcus sp. Sow4_B9 TaxID=3438792 RepID=UPI003F96ECF3